MKAESEKKWKNGLNVVFKVNEKKKKRKKRLNLLKKSMQF